MYKHAAVFVALVFLAACSHADGVGMDVDPNVSKILPGSVFQELTISYGGAVSPDSITKDITIDAQNLLAVTIARTYQDAVINSCNGSAQLTDEQHEEIVQKIEAADLMNYSVPECEPLVGGGGIAVSMVAADETTNEFSTFCQLEAQIEAVTVTVAAIGEELVPDCTEELVAAMPAPGVPTEQPPAEETKPADETTPPADETTPPADETTPPADETTPPVIDTETPPSANVGPIAFDRIRSFMTGE